MASDMTPVADNRESGIRRLVLQIGVTSEQSALSGENITYVKFIQVIVRERSVGNHVTLRVCNYTPAVRKNVVYPARSNFGIETRFFASLSSLHTKASCTTPLLAFACDGSTAPEEAVWIFVVRDESTNALSAFLEFLLTLSHEGNSQLDVLDSDINYTDVSNC